MARPNIYSMLNTQKTGGNTYLDVKTGSFLKKEALEELVNKAFMSDIASKKLDIKALDYTKYYDAYIDTHFVKIEAIETALTALGFTFSKAEPVDTKEEPKEETPEPKQPATTDKKGK